MSKLKVIYQKRKEQINYIFFGVATTAVNWIVYTISVKTSIGMNTANILAWIVAVLFAYVTNKLWVFESKSFQLKNLIKEFSSFIAARLVSGVFEIVLLPVLVYIGINQTLFGIEGFVAKIIISVFVIILNYIFSKLFVFKGERS